MRVLWLCSTMTPEIAKELKLDSAVNVSWIVNTVEQLKKEEKVELGLCFPLTNKTEIVKGIAQGLYYFGFPQKKPDPTVYNNELVTHFIEILNSYKPDVIHIWGTEYPHTLSMLKACKSLNILEKAVVSIQGLCSIYAKHYRAMLPERIIKRYTFSDLLRRENINKQIKGFKKRGEYEIGALKLAKNVIGRTDWDEACTKQINPKFNYYFCNETLRNSFYNNSWDIDKCKKHSVFVSQGYYPIKGLHFVIEAVSLLKDEYPDISLNIGGLDLVNRGWKTNSYGKYIKDLINKYDLQKHISFTGMLSEEKMCKQYLNANVFVSASSIENSPNSVGEAMILGMPVISSDVGGVKNLLKHNEEGYIYPYDAPYMLAHYIKKVFDDRENAVKLGENAKKHAEKTHNCFDNAATLVDIYNNIL